MNSSPGRRNRELQGDLEPRLSKLPGGWVRMVTGNDVVLQKNKARVGVNIEKDITFD